MHNPLHLVIENLSVSVDEKIIIKNLSLTIEPSNVHALMGQNGSGKSSLALTLMGHPRYKIISGSIFANGQSIAELTADKRAQLGMFLVFQYPYEIPGVTIATFLKEAYQVKTGTMISASDFVTLLHEKMKILQMDYAVASRAINDGFSGGEKKRLEMLQILLLQPSFIMLDEIDSGLDVDALALVGTSLALLRTQLPHTSFLVITHHQKIFQHVQPDFVHIMHQGALTRSGDKQLATLIETQGYATTP